MLNRIINDAYSIEYGDTGVAFKTNAFPRIKDPLEAWLQDAYQAGNILKAVNNSGHIAGAIYIERFPDRVYFGPFGVRPELKGQGIGSLLLKEVDRIALDAGAQFIEINVVNWRSDCIQMYEAMGYVKTSEEDFPEPEALTRPSLLFKFRKELKK